MTYRGGGSFYEIKIEILVNQTQTQSWVVMSVTHVRTGVCSLWKKWYEIYIVTCIGKHWPSILLENTVKDNPQRPSILRRHISVYMYTCTHRHF